MVLNDLEKTVGDIFSGVKDIAVEIYEEVSISDRTLKKCATKLESIKQLFEESDITEIVYTEYNSLYTLFKWIPYFGKKIEKINYQVHLKKKHKPSKHIGSQNIPDKISEIYNKPDAEQNSQNHDLNKNPNIATGNSDIKMQYPKKDLLLIKSGHIGKILFGQSTEQNSYKLFVEIGQQIKKGDLIYKIHHLRIDEEVYSEYDGTVVRILVGNNSGVMFGQEILEIEKTSIE